MIQKRLIGIDQYMKYNTVILQINIHILSIHTAYAK